MSLWHARLSNFLAILLFFGLCSFGSKSKSSDSKKEPLPQYTQDYNAGVAAQNSGNYEEAINYYQSAIAANPNFPDALNNLGYCYRYIAKSYLSKAGDAYQKAVKLDPKHALALEYQGEYFLMVGQMANSYKNYQTLKQLDPALAEALKEKLDPILDEARSVLKVYQ